MTVLGHELKSSIKTWSIWALSIGFMIVICLLLYPELGDQMNQVDDIYSNLGGFSDAFGMDKISMGTPMGFYGIECGSVMAIGCSFFAAMLGANMLSKEEHSHTAEFLLTHPISRKRVVFEKLLAVIIQIVMLNLVCIILAIISFNIIGEKILWEEFRLFHIAQLIMQLEIAFICFGISAFLKHSAMGIGIGIAALLYFLNIAVNISDKVEFLKYITPFKYADAADIISSCSLDEKLILVGIIYALISLVLAFYYYSKKDISA